MAREEFNRARAATRGFLTTEGTENHMFHGPTTEGFWDEPIRLVMLNMEAYGYDGHYEVDRDTLMDWLYDSGGSGTRTTRYSLAILAVLLERLEMGSSATWEGLQRAYADNDGLERVVDRIVYFNVNPKPNHRVEQDYAAITGMGESEMGKLIWREIQALDPHVILVSGHAGLAAINGMANFDPPLEYRGLRRSQNGTLVQSISHPSRPRYEDWAGAIEDVANKLTAMG
jgi:hypothetical protein